MALQLGCKTGREMRVVELCEFTGQKNFTELAIKYATKTRNEKLAEKLLELLKEQEREFELDFKSDVPSRYFSRMVDEFTVVHFIAVRLFPA